MPLARGDSTSVLEEYNTFMSFAKVFSAQTQLLDAHIISVEVDLSKGLHAFSIVGLPDKAVEESRDRISAAIKHAGFVSPKSKNQKVVISLAPADIKKEGPVFDLPMALAYLLATDDIKFNPDNKLFLGELSLDGKVRSVRGTLSSVLIAKEAGFEEVYVPKENAKEAALVGDIAVYPVETLSELIEHLNTKKKTSNKSPAKLQKQARTTIELSDTQLSSVLEDIRGQETAKRGLEIAAAGGHNIALYGPPGTGKTMLAKALAHILPPLSFDEMLEATAIHSVAGTLDDTLVTHAPYRAPHHTASYVSVVGGGTFPKPGEVTLAHRGVLFLDEFPEFERRVIDSLREPLEEHVVRISRARGSARFPANFILVASMNPCPCGNYGSKKECVCTPSVLQRYQRKLSGPIMDRIDMWIEVPNIKHQKLGEKTSHGETDRIRSNVLAARSTQLKRFEEFDFNKNSDMDVKAVDELVGLEEKEREMLNRAAERFDLSPRAYHRVIKLARTIADLEDSKDVGESHLLEALQYRPRHIAA